MWNTAEQSERQIEILILVRNINAEKSLITEILKLSKSHKSQQMNMLSIEKTIHNSRNQHGQYT